ncbi:uncharacterized protein [Macrobrachium rosenbergii]|uniref:uncharacterized protein n=1 Tax=Macrobrachium rosenbergii TaxID=79674 RepID=UPI0034D74456
MRVLVAVFASILAAAECNLLQTLSPPKKEFTPSSHHSHQGYSYLPPPAPTVCADGQVLHVDGRCVTPVITRSVYLFNVPQLPRRPTPLPYIPPPKVNHNILFVRLPEDLRAPDPIVVPPPQQKNIVYVLKKKTQHEGPRVIEFPTHPKTKPDVYFVGYDQDENPILPTGEDLESILTQNVQEVYGQVVDTGSSGHAVDSGSHSIFDTGSLGQVSTGSSSHVDTGSLGQVDTGFSSHSHTGSFGQVGTGSHSHVDAGSLGQVDTGSTSHINIGSLGQVDTGSTSHINIGSLGQVDNGSSSHFDIGSLGQVGTGSHSQVGTGSLGQVDFGSLFNIQDNKPSSLFVNSGSLGHPNFSYYFPPHK